MARGLQTSGRRSCAVIRIFCMLGLLLTSIVSAEEVVKTCTVIMKVPGDKKSVPTTFVVTKDGSQINTKTSQSVDGITEALPDEPAQIAEYPVRRDLNSGLKDLNQAEQLILSTDEFLHSPDIGSAFHVGIDLKSIRSAKVFVVGQFTHMGGTAIIEARDESGKNLGSFVTGFLPFECLQ